MALIRMNADCLYAVLLLSADPAKQEYPEELRSFCSARHLTMGISAPFPSFSSVPVAYAQANACFCHGETAAAFEDVIPQEVRRLCLLQAPADYFVHPVFRRIQAYDREYHVNYLETLLAYLHHHGNLRITADELRIHYNTMKHRLDVIEEIAGVSLRKDDRLQQVLTVSKLFVDG